MAKENTGKQGGAPALSNNFSGKTPGPSPAPKVGPYTPSTSQSNKRGKQGQ